MLAFETDLIEGVGVLSRSFSEPLAGVAGVTFNGSAEEAMLKKRRDEALRLRIDVRT
jgi:hypothetical protein